MKRKYNYLLKFLMIVLIAAMVEVLGVTRDFLLNSPGWRWFFVRLALWIVFWLFVIIYGDLRHDY